MKKHLAQNQSRNAQVTTGPIAGSCKIYATLDAAPDLKVPPREVALDASAGEPPVVVYDPSGPCTDPDGLPRTRIAWVKERWTQPSRLGEL